MEMNDAVPKLAVEPLDTTSSFRNQAYESLKREITQMDIYGHHGEVRLDERKLSQELGVSRTQIREALSLYEQEIGSAQVGTTVPNAHHVCRIMIANKTYN